MTWSYVSEKKLPSCSRSIYLVSYLHQYDTLLSPRQYLCYFWWAGSRSRETIYLINEERLPFSWSIDRASYLQARHGPGGALSSPGTFSMRMFWVLRCVISFLTQSLGCHRFAVFWLSNRLQNWTACIQFPYLLLALQDFLSTRFGFPRSLS